MTLESSYVTLEDQRNTVVVEGSTTTVEISPSIPWAQKYLFETVERASNYTIQVSDIGMVIPFNGLSVCTVTIPPNSSVAFPVGSLITIWNMSTNMVLIQPSGVTLRGFNTGVSQYSQAILRQRAIDEWVLSVS